MDITTIPPKIINRTEDNAPPETLVYAHGPESQLKSTLQDCFRYLVEHDILVIDSSITDVVDYLAEEHTTHVVILPGRVGVYIDPASDRGCFARLLDDMAALDTATELVTAHPYSLWSDLSEAGRTIETAQDHGWDIIFAGSIEERDDSSISGEIHTGRPPLGFRTDDSGKLARADNYNQVCSTLSYVANGSKSKRIAARELDCSRRTITRAIEDRSELYRLE
ncbi:hypothetical protein [Natrarchaeobius chitinivorans]|uniref:hypothetical protein n=1 Tax=Natrarchaeobius chitinivorans TaxID=1679083 RepID=UPI000F5370FE|nr:hypothetical protein [Natrarchaeobius chitinivorans]